MYRITIEIEVWLCERFIILLVNSCNRKYIGVTPFHYWMAINLWSLLTSAVSHILSVGPQIDNKSSYDCLKRKVVNFVSLFSRAELGKKVLQGTLYQIPLHARASRNGSTISFASWMIQCFSCCAAASRNPCRLIMRTPSAFSTDYSAMRLLKVIKHKTPKPIGTTSLIKHKDKKYLLSDDEESHSYCLNPPLGYWSKLSRRRSWRLRFWCRGRTKTIPEATNIPY